MNQTLEDLANQLRKIDDDKAVIQSLIKRVDVLESTPDATREMLAEYARDFDTLDATVKGIITGINQYQDNENAVLFAIKETVDNYHWQIDENTFRDLEDMVTKKTGFKLQNYISQIQKNVIRKEFKRLDNELKTQVKPITTTILDQAKEIKDLQEKTLTTSNDILLQMQARGNVIIILMAFLACILVGTFLMGFGSMITAFTKHPVLSSVIFVILLGFLGYVGYWAKKDYKEMTKDDNDESDDNDDEQEYTY